MSNFQQNLKKMDWQTIDPLHKNIDIMNIQNYTIKSQKLLQRAQSLATELSHQSIEPSHLLKRFRN